LLRLDVGKGLAMSTGTTAAVVSTIGMEVELSVLGTTEVEFPIPTTAVVVSTKVTGIELSTRGTTR
jgi:hypothetical protein